MIPTEFWCLANQKTAERCIPAVVYMTLGRYDGYLAGRCLLPVPYSVARIYEAFWKAIQIGNWCDRCKRRLQKSTKLLLNSNVIDDNPL